MAGNVAKRADGKWRARYRDPAGREHARHFRRKLDAERWLAAIEVSIAHGEYLDPARSRLRLEDWAGRWLAAQVQLKPSTRVRYDALLRNHVLPVWGRYPLASVSHGEVAEWVGAMVESGLSGSSVRQAHRVLSLMLSSAVRDRRLTVNVADGVRLPRAARPEKRFLTHVEVSALAEACGTYRLAVLVLAYCGVRWGELAALKVRRVDVLRRRLVVAEAASEVQGTMVWGLPKSHQRRNVPVPAFLMTELQREISGRSPNDLVFPGRRGGVLRNHNFRRDVFDVAAASVGLAGLTPHELRHTAASLAVAAGANVKAVQRMLGHASAAMTLDVYSGLFEDDLDALAEQMDAARTAADQMRTDTTQTTTGKHLRIVPSPRNMGATP